MFIAYLQLIKLVKNDKSDENKNDVNSDCEQNDKEWQVKNGC